MRHARARTIVTVLGCGLTIAAWQSGGEARADTPVPPGPTPVELEDFEATPDYRSTIDYLERLAAASPAIRLDSFGRSAEGRSLPLVIVSLDGAFTPLRAAAGGKPVVLIQNGVHAGEIDGKDASMMLLRDVARGTAGAWTKDLTLLVVPIYNVDGHERTSIHNRPNQNGPVRGMGFRTTSDGHDLNRDHVKLDTPEARAMIGLFNRWRPHLHVDNHVTNGVDHDWVLTYSWIEAPQIAPSLDLWLTEQMPPIVAATREAGHRIGPYVSLIDGTDPSKGFNSYVGEPRYATGYYPLRNRPSILVENHSYKPYRERVLANLDFMRALLGQVALAPDALMRAVRRAERRTIELGRLDAPPSTVALRYAPADTGDEIDLPVYAWRTRNSLVTGTTLVVYDRGNVDRRRVSWIHRPAVELELPRPRGYVVLPGWPVIERRLADHGIEVHQLTEAVELNVETLRLRDSATAADDGASYQGRTRRTADVLRRMEQRTLPRGSLWVPADQPDFEVAVQMFEPEAPDSLYGWGLLSAVTERKEYIGGSVLERLAREMLADPAIAEQWQLALADEGFAGDASARYAWWYRRTPHWDETVGLMPVMRVMRPPGFTTRPWSPR